MKQYTSANHSSNIVVSTGSGYSGVTTFQQAAFIASATQIVQMYWSITPCERCCSHCTCEDNMLKWSIKSVSDFLIGTWDVGLYQIPFNRCISPKGIHL